MSGRARAGSTWRRNTHQRLPPSAIAASKKGSDSSARASRVTAMSVRAAASSAIASERSASPRPERAITTTEGRAAAISDPRATVPRNRPPKSASVIAATAPTPTPASVPTAPPISVLDAASTAVASDPIN